jgi:hypothetical protein
MIWLIFALYALSFIVGFFCLLAVCFAKRAWVKMVCAAVAVACFWWLYYARKETNDGIHMIF